MKHKHHIRTFTNRMFDPFEITPADVRAEDIAHALSMTVRANGHVNHFYSVAQHAVDCAREAKARGCSQRVQLICLLHDASECYIADIPRPIKHRLLGYLEIERKVSDVVFEALGIGAVTADEALALSEMDDALLYHEFLALTGLALYPAPPQLAMTHSFEYEDMADVKRQFLKAYNELRMLDK